MRRSTSQLIFLFFFGVYTFSSAGRVDSVDGRAAFYVAQSLLNHGDFVLRQEMHEPLLRMEGVDGKLYSATSLGIALLLTPLLALGKVIAAVLPESLAGSRFTCGTYPMELAVQLLNPLFGALTCVLLFRLGRRLGWSDAVSLSVTLLYGLATMAWPDTKHLFSHPPSTFFLLLSAYALRRDAEAGRLRYVLAAGLSAGLAVLIYFSSLIALPALAVYVLMSRYQQVKRRDWQYLAQTGFSFLVGMAPPLLAMVAFNAHRFGSLWENGYSAAGNYIGFDTPLLFGLYGFLLSSGKSIFLYSPPLVLAAFAFREHLRRQRPEAAFALTLAATYLVFYARSNVWHGDWAWGPRYQAPWIPFVMLAVGTFLSHQGLSKWVKGGALAAVMGVGVTVQCLGVLVATESFIRTVPNEHSDSANWETSKNLHHELTEMHFMPNYSPLGGHWELSGRFATDAWRRAQALFTPRSVVFQEGWLHPERRPEGPVRRSLPHAKLWVHADPRQSHTLTLKVHSAHRPGAGDALVTVSVEGVPVIPQLGGGGVNSEAGPTLLPPFHWVTLTVPLPARASGDGRASYQIQLDSTFLELPASDPGGLFLGALALDGRAMDVEGPFGWRDSGFETKIGLVHNTLDFWWMSPLYTDLPASVLFVAVAQLLLALAAGTLLVRRVLQGSALSAARPVLPGLQHRLSTGEGA